MENVNLAQPIEETEEELIEQMNEIGLNGSDIEEESI